MPENSRTEYYLGIDTGGTFTDGVLLDPVTREILMTTKVLTTHHDLKICINQILDRLAEGRQAGIRLVSLSTTLATNAIVEGKSRPVGLFLLGYDSQLVHQYDFHRQFSTDRYFFISGGMDLQGREQAALDEAGLEEKALELRDQVEAWAVSSYAGTLNASHEERAGALLHKQTGLPVVQGHHLTSRLNSIRRATTASLNAGLLSTAYDFVHTVEDMLARRGIACPLVIVRGDGSLVSAGFAAQRPVEIIHSGPATSAIGGLYLSGLESGLVVDIGGTTTDLAVMERGHPIMDGGEAAVGGYHTSVRTIKARSFGLGGDSQIRFSPRGPITVGPERVVPLSYLAQAYPDVKKDLEAWLIAVPERFYSDKIEYWMLRREPRQPFNDPRTNKALDLLRSGPKRLPWLLKQSGAVSTIQVDGALLLRQDIIARAGLTPTDLLHVTGEYTPYDSEVACLAVAAIAQMRGVSPEEFIEQAREVMTRKIAAEIIGFVTGHPLPEEEIKTEHGGLARWMFEENLSGTNPFLGCRLALKMPIIGIGAPARAFLDPVGRALGTEVIYPPCYEVANAVGTVVGNVLVQKEFEVLPRVIGQMVNGYLVRTGSEQRVFETAALALEFAREEIARQVFAEACAAGAVEPEISVEQVDLLGDMYTLRAKAVGKPGRSGSLVG